MNTVQELITLHNENIIQIKIPVPLSLKSVNSYLLKDGDGYVWVDPTLNTKDIQHVWTDIFYQLNIKPNKITKIICTHQHPDHFGLAGYAQQLTSAPVYMSQKSLNHANLLWGDTVTFPQLLQTLFLKHGVPMELVDAIVENLHWFHERVYPFPTITIIQDEEVMDINGAQWVFHETSGHAKGHMMLYNMHKKIVICGDQVLPHITPHVGVVPSEENESPLAQFLDCLMQIRGLEVDRAFPGHGAVILSWQERIDSIIAHHERRLQKMSEIIEEKEAVNAFEMSNKVFGTHLHKQPQNLRFAITEIIAHLDYLAGQEDVIKSSSAEHFITYSSNKKKQSEQ